jgi:hypothetical protein
MSGLSSDFETSIRLDDGYLSLKITVGTSQVEAKVGATRLIGREILYIENVGNNDIFYGPSGVTSTGTTQGAVQTLFLEAGPNRAIFLISTGAGSEAIIQEFA